MLVALAQMNATPGNLDENENAMLSSAYAAQSEGAELIIYSAHCMTGLPVDGLAESHSFIVDAIKHLEQFASITPIPAIVSCLTPVEVEGIDDEVNAPALFIVHDGEYELLGIPELEDEDSCLVTEINDVSFAILLEEHFSPDCELGNIDVFVELAGNCFEEPTAVPAARGDLERIRALCKTSHANFAYVNPVGVNDSFVFAGNTLAMSSTGMLWHACSIEEPEILIFDTDIAVADYKVNDEDYELNFLACKWNLLKLAIKDYVQKNNMSDVLIGLSGGIDSATVATLAVDALGSEHVHGVFLPGPYTSKESFEDAFALADNLKIDIKTISINDVFEASKHSLEQALGEPINGVTPENLQARIRANFLMAISNMYSYLLLNTGNKSEAAMGFTTLYGDSVGAYAPLGDLYKTEVYEIANYRNSIDAIIPNHIIKKDPSSELYEDAKDSDRLPPYDLLDVILMAHIEGGLSAQDLQEEDLDPATINFVLESVQHNEFKRRQEPLSPHLDGMSLTQDRNWPITNGWNDKI